MDMWRIPWGASGWDSAFTAQDLGLTPGQGTKIPPAVHFIKEKWICV